MHAVAAAEADLQRAEAELANADTGVPQRQAAKLLAEIDLERTVIRSPIDGIVVGARIQRRTDRSGKPRGADPIHDCG